MKIWAMPVQRPYNPNARRMAEVIQADFAKVGVEVEIVSYEWGEYLKRSKETDRDGAVLLGWTGDNGDPDNFLAVLLGCDGVGGSNRAQWCHQPFEDLIQKAKVSDKGERTKLYEEAQVSSRSRRPGQPSPIRWCSCRCPPRFRATSWIRWAVTGSTASTSPNKPTGRTVP
jgi:dipeptide transport system substrate-binding protein